MLRLAFNYLFFKKIEEIYYIYFSNIYTVKL